MVRSGGVLDKSEINIFPSGQK